MSEDDKKGNLPEGRRVSKRKSSRETLYLKRQQLLREMQTADERPISVREQVDKLKSSSAEPSKEEDWGSKAKRKKGSLWMLWAILGLAIPVVLVALMLMTSRNREVSVNDASATGLDFDVLSGGGKVEPEDWFVQNTGEAFSDSIEILEKVSEPDLTLEEVEPLVRSPEHADYLLELERAGKWAAFDTSQPTDLTWGYGSSAEAGFMTVTGVRKDFRDFRAYFVRGEQGLLMDVMATEGFSSVPIQELPGKILQGSALLRCWVAKEPHFDARSDEKLFSWYQILSPNQVDFVWAYCKRGDPLDEKLREELNYGRLIGDRVPQFRATIKIGNARGFREDEFLVEELLATEWVVGNAE